MGQISVRISRAYCATNTIQADASANMDIAGMMAGNAQGFATDASPWNPNLWPEPQEVSIPSAGLIMMLDGNGDTQPFALKDFEARLVSTVYSTPSGGAIGMSLANAFTENQTGITDQTVRFEMGVIGIGSGGDPILPIPQFAPSPDGPVTTFNQQSFVSVGGGYDQSLKVIPGMIPANALLGVGWFANPKLLTTGTDTWVYASQYVPAGSLYFVNQATVDIFLSISIDDRLIDNAQSRTSDVYLAVPLEPGTGQLTLLNGSWVPSFSHLTTNSRYVIIPLTSLKQSPIVGFQTSTPVDPIKGGIYYPSSGKRASGTMTTNVSASLGILTSQNSSSATLSDGQRDFVALT
jgi:hypothetical protein